MPSTRLSHGRRRGPRSLERALLDRRRADHLGVISRAPALHFGAGVRPTGNRTPNDTNVRAAVGLPSPKELVIAGASPPNTLPSSTPTIVPPTPNDPPMNAVFRFALKSVFSLPADPASKSTVV